LSYVRVDSAGRVRGSVPTHPALAASPGRSVQLSVDLSLQQHIAELVAPTARAGVVALEPRSGEVLALYSSPSFDPNLPASVLPGDPWGAWQEDPAHPLLNRAIEVAYSPGFPWAATTAVAALRLGIVDEATPPPLPCRGGIVYADRYFRCSDPRGHGSLGLYEALQQSCDVYFYQLALQISFERLVAAGARAGFGRVTGIDLPGEHPGALPAPPPAHARGPEVESVVAAMELATGRGPVAVSALQLARFYAALATGRGVPSPRVVRAEGGAVGATTGPLSLGLGTAGRAWVRKGLGGASRARGLAFEPRLEEWDWSATEGAVSGSTGTDHDWFVGLGGRGEVPEIVVVVVVESGTAGMDAGQVAAGVVAHYLAGGGLGLVADGL
jgi:penicillin-binding protein 2